MSLWGDSPQATDIGTTTTPAPAPYPDTTDTTHEPSIDASGQEAG